MVDTPDRIAFLKKIHLFHGLEDNELEAIANVMEEVPVANGGVIFAQDSKSEGFYMKTGITRQRQPQNQVGIFIVSPSHHGSHKAREPASP